MNIKQRLLVLNEQETGLKGNIDDMLIVIITKYQLFEPCRYLGEDDEWVNVSMISIEDENLTQPMSIRKSEISMFGIFNPAEIKITQIKTGPEDFYQ